MGLQEIIAVLIAIACGAYVLRMLYREVAGKQNCGCGALSRCEKNDRPIQIGMEKVKSDNRESF